MKFQRASFDFSSTFVSGQRESNINISEGEKAAVILESEAAMTRLINTANGYFERPSFFIYIVSHHLKQFILL